ncbi:hypothetical protein MLD38_005378 [Melastoma candidum]|uniref:Uncharacterized protein n=1 Tax=Melastoma candidum TaxID=119954 RepID=A0ACB9S8R7_9MYRT|nr:hypothetical protein MLD38_005378 [Melastoma candidum]
MFISNYFSLCQSLALVDPPGTTTAGDDVGVDPGCESPVLAGSGGGRDLPRDRAGVLLLRSHHPLCRRLLAQLQEGSPLTVSYYLIRFDPTHERIDSSLPGIGVFMDLFLAISGPSSSEGLCDTACCKINLSLTRCIRKELFPIFKSNEFNNSVRNSSRTGKTGTFSWI